MSQSTTQKNFVCPFNTSEKFESNNGLKFHVEGGGRGKVCQHRSGPIYKCKFAAKVDKDMAKGHGPIYFNNFRDYERHV